MYMHMCIYIYIHTNTHAQLHTQSHTHTHTYTHTHTHIYIYIYKALPLVTDIFIDDIFFIWEHREEKLKEFIDVLNKKHPTIKFTAEWSKTQINFLDVTVYLENENIKTDLYVKSTDTHQYLHSSSYHPYHCKKGIPYSQALSLNRICSDSRSFDRDVMTWKDGY